VTDRVNSRRKLFEKFEEWGFKKNRKRHRDQKEDTGIRSGDKHMLGNTTIRIAKRQHIPTMMILAPSGMFRLDREVVSKLMSYLQGTTAPGISCFDLEQDHNTTTSGITLRARSPPSSDFASGLVQTTYFPVGSQLLEASTVVRVRESSSTPSVVHIDNIPWFKFLELVHTFMKQQRSMGSLSQ
jgi:hypothetical protein